jgi:hypothetical protein
MNKSIFEIGHDGEKIALEVFKQFLKVDSIFQADWIVEKNNNYYLIEVKHQERYKKIKRDDIEGHGLPLWQVKARMKFQKATGIRVLFFVVEKPTGIIFWQWMDELEKTNYQDTSVKKRRIYEINNFKVLYTQKK